MQKSAKNTYMFDALKIQKQQFLYTNSQTNPLITINISLEASEIQYLIPYVSLADGMASGLF